MDMKQNKEQAEDQENKGKGGKSYRVEIKTIAERRLTASKERRNGSFGISTRFHSCGPLYHAVLPCIP